MSLILNLITRAAITQKRVPSASSRCLHLPRVCPKSKTVNIPRDMLRQIQMHVPWQTGGGTHIATKRHCKTRLISCQLTVCVPRVHSLNISPHCPQPVSKVVSKLLNMDRSALPHSLRKGITAL
eukprot:773150-Pelagomonas_calceolata.AAC.1